MPTDQQYPASPFPQPPGNHHCLLCFDEFDYFGEVIEVVKLSRPLGGSWTQAFLGPSCLVFRELASASMSFPEGRFEQELIGEGRGCRDKGGTVKKQQCSLGVESWLLLQEYT